MKIQTILLKALSVLMTGAFLVPQFAYALTVDTSGSATVNASGAATNITTGASASTSASGAAAVRVDAKLQAAKDKGTKEIDRRIAALADLSARVENMQRVTANFKQTLTANIKNQSDGLAQLKVKIDADTEVADLKTDVKTITDSYRVFMLVLPQARIATAADREVTIITMMNQLGAKLQARLSAAQSAGATTTSLMTALSDMSAKLADASTQAQAAVSVSAGLTADEGDKTKMDQNNAALKTAKADLAASQKDLIAARKDAEIVIVGLKKLPTPTVNASSSAQTTTQ